MTVLSPDEARSHLNMQQTTYNDMFLQGYIDAAVAYVENRVGPLEQRTFTEQVWGGDQLLLNNLPVVSITSITPTLSGAAAALTGVRFDPVVGTVFWANGSPLTPQPYDVVYVAGRATVPPDLLLAVKEVLRMQVRTQRSGTKRPGAEQTAPPRHYSGPIGQRLVDELLAPHLMLGFA